jgi:hypothetical protein
VPSGGDPDRRSVVRYGLSYRDLEELLAERRIEVDHVTLFGTVALRVTVVILTPPAPRGNVGIGMPMQSLFLYRFSTLLTLCASRRASRPNTRPDC